VFLAKRAGDWREWHAAPPGVKNAGALPPTRRKRGEC
jgi:hypothetical protein